MKSSNPYLYTLPRRERDPMGIVFPLIGLLIWLGAASCWAATQDVARTFGYQASLGRPLFEHIYRPLSFDAAGRRLFPWPRGHYRLRPGELWLYADNDRSWDSRYWGPAQADAVRARALPLLVAEARRTRPTVPITLAAFVFQYGSNMSRARMRDRIPEAEPIEAAWRSSSTSHSRFGVRSTTEQHRESCAPILGGASSAPFGGFRAI